MQLVNDNDRKGKKDAKQSERPIVFQEKTYNTLHFKKRNIKIFT